jgi:hypothetical protein
LASWIGIFALLFAQLMISAHACPMTFSAPDPVGAAAPCHSLDMTPSDLCYEHGQQGGQVLDQSPSAAIPDAFVPAFIATLPLPAAIPAPPVLTLPSPSRATAPPLAIRNCCFRI